MKVTLAPTSEPMTGSSGRRPRPLLGISSGPSEKGVLISRVTPGFAAANAGLRSGDVIVKIDGSKTPTIGTLRAILAKHKPGDQIVVVYTRDDKEKETKVKLGAAGGPRGWDARPNRRRTWSKPTYRLAVIPVEFSDVSHNEKIGTKNWTTALFSKGEYSDKSVTGQKVFGSLNDYYREISYGKFTVTGKVFDFVKVEKKRNDYSNSGPRRSTLLVEAVDLLLERDGEDALKDFDGIFFLYAGARARTQRGGLYWPHRATFTHRRKRWSYFICPEGGGRMESISVIAHEFGHMLGLPDLYAQQGSTTRAEGLGVWCTMSTGHGRSGRPLHFSAWTKEQLGWIEPAVIDPRVKQKLVLEPIIDSNEECYKVLLKPDASEYLLLENRVKQGFDSNLPGEGLLIWRVVNGRPILLESHGITDTSGPKRYLSAVPFPSKSNSSFTPRTIPSSKGTSGSYPVHITNIQRLEDGRIIFYIGYELF